MCTSKGIRGNGFLMLLLLNMNTFDKKSIFCCTACGKNTLTKHKNTYICTRCKKEFPIYQGIPVFVDLDHLPEHLRKQVLYFEKEDLKRGKFVLEPWQKSYVDEFVKNAALAKKSCIIDNATGSGYMAIELAKRGHFVIATDLTMRELTQLKVALKKLHLERNVLLVCCSSERLPIRSGIADGMIANAILEHLPNEKSAIKEIGRVLKKRAILMVAMPIKFRYVFPLLWPLNWLHDQKIGHLRRYTREIILKRFPMYKEITTYYTGHVVKVICSIIYLVTKKKVWLSIAESSDRSFRQSPYWASNVVTIMKKL